jgi:hypothetical protein
VGFVLESGRGAKGISEWGQLLDGRLSGLVLGDIDNTLENEILPVALQL